MRALILSAALLVTASAAVAQPPAKWEYAELSYRSVPARSERTDAEGKKIDATPAYVSIRWTTAAEEVTLKGWEELATKLKLTLKDGSAAFQRVQVLNALGASGWELAESQGISSLPTRSADPRGEGRGVNPFASGTPMGAGTTLLFKRAAK